MTEETKSLSAWRLDLKRYGKSHWLKFYENFLGSPVSNKARFYRAISLYGEWAVFEAVIATSEADITGDPLNYFYKVASNKWKEAQKDEDEEADYVAQIEEAKKISQQKNEELAKKLNAKSRKK
jgi:nitrogen regulatory protein PII-like uncharacterized protein